MGIVSILLVQHQLVLGVLNSLYLAIILFRKHSICIRIHLLKIIALEKFISKEIFFTLIIMMEQMAIEYFRSLTKSEKKNILRKIIGAMTPDEKIELAKLLIKK